MGIGTFLRKAAIFCRLQGISATGLQAELPGTGMPRIGSPLRILRGLCLVLLLAAGSLLPLGSLSTAYAEEEETYVVIHKKRNRLTVIMNDIPVYSFPVTTGRGELTPVGEFRIVTKVNRPFYLRKKIAGGHPDNPLGTRWMGLSVGNGYKYGIHGTNRPWQIGQSVSSGCVRMRNKDVEFLYRHVPLRTRVVIVDD